ncbi:MAG: YkgJ family cysteine cluster protein [Polyangiaceae bacterium]
MTELRETYLRYDDDPGEIPDCRDCGACCRVAGDDGRILVYANDLIRWRREERDDILGRLVDGHFGQRAFAATPDGHCVHLGTDESPHLCSIYDTRGRTCRVLEPGSRQCFEYRREAGLSGDGEAPNPVC